jgi:hypothetical protein
VRALEVVKVKVALQCRQEVDSAGEVAGINQFVLERAPQSLDENVVESSTTTIHADRDAALLKWSEELGGGELRALIGVPDFWLAEAEGGVERSQAKAGFQGVGEFPTEHESAEPIHDRNQVEKAATHGNVSNIGTPDMIGPENSTPRNRYG